MGPKRRNQGALDEFSNSPQRTTNRKTKLSKRKKIAQKDVDKIIESNTFIIIKLRII